MVEFVITCPHCLDYIIIKKINCGIFRHGILISNRKQIDNHATKKMCDNYIIKKKIYGCGKPYQIIKEGDEYKVNICEYI
jgi:hypothetical protein